MLNPFSGLTPQSVACMCLASMGALLFGFDNGWWATILGSPRFLKDYGSCTITAGVEKCQLSTSQVSAGSSVQSGGIMIGCAIASYVNNRLGRRYALVVTACISIVGVIIEITSGVGETSRYTQFVIGKVVASIAMGMVVNIVPVYLSETSPASARGLGISLYQNVQIIGVIAAAGCVYGTSVMDSRAAYLIPMGVQLFAPTVMILVTPIVPESPRWLVLNGRQAEAELAAVKLLGSEAGNAAEYCERLRIAYEQERLLATTASWRDLTHGPVLRRTLIAVGIQSLQQAQGASYMNSYLVSFLIGMGVTNYFPVIMGLRTLYWFSVTAGGFLADITGRRILLMCSGAFCGCCLVIVASITAGVPVSTGTTQKACIALIFLWEASFGIQSPCVWIVTTESAPTSNREMVLAAATFFGFGVSLLITSVAPFIQNADYGNLGSKIGFIWGAFSLITVVWVFFMVPEMKGHSLEQLDWLYSEATPTRAFSKHKFADDVIATEETDEYEAGKKEVGGVSVVPVMSRT